MTERSAPMDGAHHLEVMVGPCPPAEFAAIREFLQLRGYRLSESRQGPVYRLWADPPPNHQVHRPRESDARIDEEAERAERDAEFMRLAGPIL